MAYECSMCPDNERGRFVFMDLSDGNVASSCEGHVFEFLTAMTQFCSQALGVPLSGVEGQPVAVEESGLGDIGSPPIDPAERANGKQPKPAKLAVVPSEAGPDTTAE